MALKPYQTVLLPGVIYAVSKSGIGVEQVQPSLEVIGGNVNIYGSNDFPASPPTGMYQTASAFIGIDAFKVVPNYIYITGSPTKIIASGLDVKVATS